MPALTPTAALAAITAGKLAPIYVLVGDDVALMDQLLDAIEGAVDPADRPFAVERVYAGEDGGQPMDIASAIRVLPMLGDRRIVIVLRAERLLKPKRAAKAEEGADDEASDAAGGGAGFGAGGGSEAAGDLRPLEDYIAAASSKATLVFVASEIDRTRRFTKKLIEVAQVVTFGGLERATPIERRDARNEVGAQIAEELKRAGKQVAPPVVRTLVERAGQDISKLRGDVARLMLYTEGRAPITLDDLEAVVSESDAVDDEWAVVNAIGAGDAARALREVGRRLDRGDSVHGLVGQLRWWVSTRLVEGDPARVKPALEALLRTDLALKRSGDERVLIERLVVELTGRPVAAPKWGGRG